MTERLKQQLIEIVRREAWLMGSLRAARSLQFPDWYIAAGAIRNTVWNILHGFPGISHLKDVDVVYFDSHDLEGIKEKTSKTLLQNMQPSVKWDVVNQARAPSFNSQCKNIHSSCASIAYWSETCTCVGVRLEEDDSITVCAPHGLHDLFHLLVKPVPAPYQDLNLYAKRIQGKRWRQIWPKLKITLYD